jgi:hypothetical protein
MVNKVPAWAGAAVARTMNRVVNLMIDSRICAPGGTPDRLWQPESRPEIRRTR